MNRAAVLVLVLVVSLPSQLRPQLVEISDEFGGVPIQTLLRIADLVVVGRLRSVSEWSQDGRECGRGVIEVSDVIWGAAAAGDTLVLEWRQFESPRPRRDEAVLMERDWIWLLSARAPGRVGAVRTYSASRQERSRIERIMASHPVIIRCDPCRYTESGTASVSLGYRNYGTEAREFPGLAFADSILYVDPRVNVVFTLSPGLGIDPRPGHLRQSESVPALRVDPMSEGGISFDPRAVFPMRRGRDFRVTLQVDGYGQQMSCGIRVMG
jgi:hypothetical protein